MKNTQYHKTRASFLTLAASATILLAGCSKTESGLNVGRTELKITSTIEMTRSGSPDTQAKQIATGEKVTVWVSDRGDGTSLYAVKLTAEADGALAGSTKMYYPQTGNEVNVTALHGDFTLSGEGIPSSMPTAINFSVSDDQSTVGGTNYLESDLLYASRSAKRSSAAVLLSFYHMLSKLELNISKSSEVTDEIAGVTFNDIALGGTFTPGAVSDITDQTSRAAGISAGSTTGTITLGNSISDSNEAIIVPQNIGGKTLTFTLASGGQLVYTFPSGTTFESGKKYVYNVMLKLTGMSITSSISDWDASTETDGDATMPETTNP